MTRSSLCCHPLSSSVLLLHFLIGLMFVVYSTSGWHTRRIYSANFYFPHLLLIRSALDTITDWSLRSWLILYPLQLKESSCHICRISTPGVLILNHLQQAKTTVKSWSLTTNSKFNAICCFNAAVLHPNISSLC